MISNYDFCSECFIVEKIIEVVVKIGEVPKQIRIEALCNISSGQCGQYRTRSYYQECIKIQPTSTENENEIESKWVWLEDDLIPWTSGDNADQVISQALSFLNDICIKNRKSK
ncbi:MAG: hypothetical protein NT106_11530 [Candidatus Sumerlaeota bacterium]|nr:hypothetical protein [Candidatus Sumerlaeota bacterium]